MNEDNKFADLIKEDINRLVEHINLIIDTHNKQLDELEDLINKTKEI